VVTTLVFINGFEGTPQETGALSGEQLRAEGMVGIYKRDGDATFAQTKSPYFAAAAPVRRKIPDGAGYVRDLPPPRHVFNLVLRGSRAVVHGSKCCQ
jgi:hypothetical protein